MKYLTKAKIEFLNLLAKTSYKILIENYESSYRTIEGKLCDELTEIMTKSTEFEKVQHSIDPVNIEVQGDRTVLIYRHEDLIYKITKNHIYKYYCNGTTKASGICMW